MPDFDVAHLRPLTLALELGDTWIDLTEQAHFAAAPNVIRIQATDLREAQRKTSDIRSQEARQGRDPGGVTVLVDIEVLTAPDGPLARTEFALFESRLTTPQTPGSLRYVGTPTGLAGLIADIVAVNVADGVTLQPLQFPGVLGDIAGETIPWLETVGFQLASEHTDLIRELRASHRREDADAWGRVRFQPA